MIWELGIRNILWDMFSSRLLRPLNGGVSQVGTYIANEHKSWWHKFLEVMITEMLILNHRSHEIGWDHQEGVYVMKMKGTLTELWMVQHLVLQLSGGNQEITRERRGA